jgi:hypothetical protein
LWCRRGNLRAVASRLPFDPVRNPLAVIGPESLGEPTVHSPLFHFQMHQGNRGQRLAIDALRREASMVSPRLDVRLAQRLVRERCPPLADVYELLTMIGQAAAPAFAQIHIDPRLRTQPGRRHLASRRQQVRMEVAWVATRWGFVNREIHGHFVALGDLTREKACERDPAHGVKLRGQRDLVFSCHSRVVAFLCVLRRIPEALAIPRPGNWHTVELRRQEDLRVLYVAAPNVLAVALRVHLETLLQALLEGRICTREEVRDFVRELEREALQYEEN